MLEDLIDQLVPLLGKKMIVVSNVKYAEIAARNKSRTASGNHNKYVWFPGENRIWKTQRGK